MHPNEYRRVFALVRRRWCEHPRPRPLSFEQVAQRVIDTALDLMEDSSRVDYDALENLVEEPWLWNELRFARTCSILVHPLLRTSDARMFTTTMDLT